MRVNCLSSKERNIFLSKSVEKNEAIAEFFSTDEDKKIFRSEVRSQFTLNFIKSSSIGRFYEVNATTAVYHFSL